VVLAQEPGRSSGSIRRTEQGPSVSCAICWLLRVAVDYSDMCLEHT